MAEPHVVTALVAKRAELSGELANLDERRAAIKAHIAHLDAVLRLFRYSIAVWLARADRDGSLGALFKPELSPPERAVAQVEGWILGVA